MIELREMREMRKNTETCMDAWGEGGWTGEEREQGTIDKDRYGETEMIKLRGELVCARVNYEIPVGLIFILQLYQVRVDAGGCQQHPQATIVPSS